MVSSDGGDLINGQDCFTVLIVDSSPTSLHNLEQLLKRCTYEVIKCQTAAEALSTLQEERSKLDIVISDRQLSDMNGLDLLRQISEIDNRLPVIMVSAEESKEALWESMMAGACDHLVKPIKMEAINDLWKHGLRKKVECLKDLQQLHMMRSDDHQQFIISDHHHHHHHHADHNPIIIKPTDKVIINCKKKKYTDQEVVDNNNNLQQQHGGDINNDCSGSDHDQAGAPHLQNGGANKKQRLIWTRELHHNFIAAVNQLGGDKAVPKKILECMHSRGFTEITRENVASHLQKYRLHLQKKENPNYQKLDHAAVNCMESKKFSIFEQAAASPPLMSTCPPPSSIQYSYNPCTTSPLFLAPPATTPGEVGLPLAVDHHQAANFLLEPKTQEPGGYIVYNSINNNYTALRNTTAIHGSVISNLPSYKAECCAPIDQEYMLYSNMGNLHVVHDQQVRPLPIDDEMAYEPAFVFRQQQQQQYQLQQAQDHDIFHRVP